MNWQAFFKQFRNNFGRGKGLKFPIWQRFLGGIAAVSLLGGLQIGGFLAPLEEQSHTLLFRLRGSRTWDDRIVVIGIDEKAIEELEAFSWSRSHYAKLLEILGRSQPKAVIFDVLMPEVTLDDGRFAKAMQQGIPVILPVAWDRNGRLLHAPDPLRQAASAQGHIASPRTSQAIKPRVQGYLSLGLAIAEIESLDVTLPQLNRSLWIDWPGSMKEAAEYSLADALQGTIPQTAFTDKIVLVGATALGFDPLITPYDVNPPASGVYLHAATIDNLLRRSFFHSLQPGNSLVAWLLYGLSGLGWSFFLAPQPMRRQIASGGTAIATWIILCGIGFYSGYLLPIVSPIAILGITVLTTLFQRLVQIRAIVLRALQYDALTGLPERGQFLQQLKQYRVAQNGRYALMLLNLDRFGDMNANRGQNSSDRLLVAISDRLQNILQGSLFADCLLGRGGQDEFLIFYPQPDSSATVVFLARTIDECLQGTFTSERQQAFSRISLGIALSWESTDSPEELLSHARVAMYRTKLQERRHYTIFDPQLHQAAIALWQLESDFRQALGGLESRLEQEFCIHYQPIVHLDTGRIFGFEALVRWQHPQRGLVAPLDFIPLAEETGLIDLLGRWVLYKACYQLRTWQSQLREFGELMIAVNLSPSQLWQPDLVAQVHSVLEATGLDSHCLKLEITESSLTSNEEDAIAVLHQLRALGVTLSLDDFGIGHSSLNRLYRFPLNLLKIDKSFVRGLGSESESLTIVRTIVELARTLDIKVVAEGIETQAQLQQLQHLQCNYGQGYLFSKPLDAIAAETFLLENSANRS